MSFCVSVSFAAVYLQALGYSNGMLGLIMALGSVMGITVSITLSSWIDSDEKITAKKLIPWILSLQTVSVLTLFLVNTRCAAVSAAFVTYTGFCTAVNCLNLKLYADADRAGSRIDYGFTRGVGSVAYVAISVVLGLLTDRVSSRMLPATGLALCAVQFLAFILSGNTWQLTAAFILQAPSYALYMAAVVPYVKENIDYRDSAKAQSLAFTTTTFGGMLASLISGQLYDCMSVTAVLWIAFAAGAAGAAVMFFGTRKPRNSSETQL